MLNSGGGRERLGGISDNSSQCLEGNDSVSVLVKTSDDDGSANNSGWEAVFKCTSL